MKFSILTVIFAGCAFAVPLVKDEDLAVRSPDLISWSSVSSSIESLLENDYAEYLDQEAANVSKSVMMVFFADVLEKLFSEHAECQDTFLIDYATGVFYNHLITNTNGNIALTISSTVNHFDMKTPEEFFDVLQTLDDTLQQPIYDLLDVLNDLELQPAWELTKELSGFLHSSENAGFTYRYVMMTAMEKIVRWFEENVDKCSADESTYVTIASAMEGGDALMTKEASQTQIHNLMAPSFAKMDATDVELIDASLTRAKIIRNLIWTKLKATLAGGRTVTQSSASRSIAAVLYTGGTLRKRQIKNSQDVGLKLLMRKLLCNETTVKPSH